MAVLSWIAATKRTSASGMALPSLLSFKVNFINTAWIIQNSPPNWKVLTSISGRPIMAIDMTSQILFPS